MATTAIHAPVTAVVEYNYERDGAVLIPAGSRVVGKISQADPSGLVNITFSSIEFPGGENVAIDAVAADMSLQAVKGTVTGKQAGRSMLVRSLAGIGETAAMIVGAPSANGAVMQYLNRMPTEMRVLAIRDAAARNRGITHTPEFVRFGVEHAEVLQ
jgi:hypothetical protein